MRTLSLRRAVLLLVWTVLPGTVLAQDRIDFPASWPYAEEARPVSAPNGMVVSTDRRASEIGTAVLKAGGNAVDAAIAVSFALAVVNPEAGNIGGGGFMVIRNADGETATLDYRETAPLAASRDMYLDEAGNLTEKSEVGHLSVGVPGTVRGLWDAHQRMGSLPWSDLVAPAIELAKGVAVHERLRRAIAGSLNGIRRFESTAKRFLPDGVPPEQGEMFRQPELAATLERIRTAGPDGFYRGETADLIVAEMERGGGIITHEDLASYRAVWREAVTTTYRGYTLISMPPPSSGGVTISEIANILEPYDLRSMGWHSPESIHLFVEAARRAYADRNEYLADPDFVEMPVARLTSKAYAGERGADIRMDRATPSSLVGPGAGIPEEGENTTHFSIIDARRNAVVVTTTINSLFGSKVTVPGAGFVLNNEMDDFTARPGSPNQYGLVQGENNAIAPGKRMLSAMTPTIVLDEDGDLFMVSGTPGGAMIITTVFQTISNVIDFGMSAAQAVLAPRVHHQHLPDRITFETGGLRPGVVRALEALGHRLSPYTSSSPYAPFIGDAEVIVVAPDGTLQGFADPRRGGGAAVGH
jgi:gamma-glutamyltranspeptidase / glutathione hydrolase